MYDYDDTPYGRDGDHCPWCGHDWKEPHDRDCRQFHQCEYPPGCERDSAPGRNGCQPHIILVSALLGSPNDPAPTDEQITWARTELGEEVNT